MDNSIKLALIVAADLDNTIGVDNHLIWDIPEDLVWFSEQTKGHPIIMGRKTFDSLPKVLPGRTHYVVTRSPENCDKSHPDVVFCNSIQDAIAMAKYEALGQGFEKVFVIGGGQIYKQVVDQSDLLYLTRIHHRFRGDAHFPDFEKCTHWLEIYNSNIKSYQSWRFSFHIMKADRAIQG